MRFEDHSKILYSSTFGHQSLFALSIMFTCISFLNIYACE